jgi:hypothetical protein
VCLAKPFSSLQGLLWAKITSCENPMLSKYNTVRKEQEQESVAFSETPKSSIALLVNNLCHW